MLHFTYSQPEISEVAQRLLERAETKTLAFNAPMGAGKTTLIKAMLRELGAADAGSSPTFGIVNEYHDKEGKLLAYHFDFYRLNDDSEALDLGLEDYLDQNVWMFIEWPEKIESLLPRDILHVYIEILDTQTRKLHT